MTTTQEPCTRSPAVVPAQDLLATRAISLEDLAAVTGGSDDDRSAAHELVHVIQQR
jgi:hypothetical protein